MPYMDTIQAIHYNLSVPYVSPQYLSFTPSSGLMKLNLILNILPIEIILALELTTNQKVINKGD